MLFRSYLIPGTTGLSGLSASIVPVATSLVGTNTIGGSLYLGDTQLWYFNTDATATKA